MKAAVLERQNSPLTVKEVTIPKLDVGQVLVRIEWSGICGKQLDEIYGKRGEDPHIPHLLGHEASGIVEDIGPGVRKVKAGDHVVLHWMKGSGIDSQTPKFKSNGTIINAGWITTFSEYTIASENRVTPIPKEIPLDVASLLGCAVTTGLGIVFNDASLTPGQSIAVFGAGGVGLNVIQGAVLVNAYPIVAIDLQDEKLDRARSFGATHVFNAAQKDIEEVLKGLSDEKGFDVVVDAVGNASVIEQAYRVVSNSGKLILAGVVDHKTQVKLDSFPLHFGRKLIGSHGGNTKPDVDIPRYTLLYKLGRLKLDEQITHRYSLDEINQALNHLRQHESGKCLIKMH